MMDLSDKAITIAGLFRLGRHVEAAVLLVDYFDELLAVTDVNPTDLKNVIASIVNCQERNDWLGLADFLEYELVHILRGQASDAA